MMRFYIVDTDTAYSSMLEQMLKGRGVDCASFANSKMAYDSLKHEGKSVHLVILSKEQSGENDGLAILDAIRKEYHIRNTPVILTSSKWGKADFAKHQKGENGANGYFSKSASVAELEAVIESVLGTRLNKPAGAAVAPAAPPSNDSVPKDQSKGSGITLDVQLMPTEEILKNTQETPIQLFEASEIAGGTPIEKISIDIGTSAESSPPASPPPVTETVEAVPPITLANTTAVSGAPPVEATSAVPDLSSVSVTMAKQQLDSLVAQSEKSSQPEVSLDPAPRPPVNEVPIEATQSPDQSLPTEQVSDEDVAKELPYLFSEESAAGSPSSVTRLTGLRTRKPAFDAKISLPGADIPVSSTPGSDLAADDIETLKRYLAMREQDVSVLTVQLTYAKEELNSSQKQIQDLTLKNEDLYHQLDDIKKKLTELQAERAHQGASVQSELEAAKVEIKEKGDRIKLLEAKLGDSAKQYDRLKDRVRVDIRKIRAREKELESKLEILRKDSETLIASRENKILDLKRKVDLLEFNYDVLQDSNEVERNKVIKANEKIERVLKVLRLALGMIENDDPVAENQKTNDGDKEVQVS